MDEMRENEINVDAGEDPVRDTKAAETAESSGSAGSDPVQWSYGQVVPPVYAEVPPGYGSPVPPQVQAGWNQPGSSQPGYGSPVPPVYSQTASSGYVNAVSPVPPQVQAGWNQPGSPQPGYSGSPVPPQPGYGQAIPPVYGNAVPPVPPQTPPVNWQIIPPQAPPMHSSYGNGQQEQGAEGMAIASMVLGMVSIVLCVWFYLAIPCAIVGLTLGCVYRARGGKNGMAIAGISCSGAGIAIGMIVFLAFLVAV